MKAHEFLNVCFDTAWQVIYFTQAPSHAYIHPSIPELGM